MIDTDTTLLLVMPRRDEENDLPIYGILCAFFLIKKLVSL